MNSCIQQSDSPLKKEREREQTQVCGRSNKRCICAPFITMSSSDTCRYCLAERGTGKDYHSPMSSAGEPPLALLLPSSLEAGQDREGQCSANGTSQGMHLHAFFTKNCKPWAAECPYHLTCLSSHCRGSKVRTLLQQVPCAGKHRESRGGQKCFISSPQD